MNTHPARTLRELLKRKFKSPEDLLARLGFAADEILPALGGMAFDSKLAAGTMGSSPIRAKDYLSKRVRGTLDALSPETKQAVITHLSKNIANPHLGERNASDLKYSKSAVQDRRNLLSHDDQPQLNPRLAAAIMQHVEGHFQHSQDREEFRNLLAALCGQQDFDQISEDQLPLLGALGGLGEAAAGAGEAAAGGAGGLSAGEGAALGAAMGGGGGGGEEREGEDQSFTSPGPRNFGAMPRPGGSMSAPRRGAMDSKQKATFDAAFPEAARIKVLDAPTYYRDGVPVREPYRLPRARRLPASIAMDEAEAKAARKADKAFAKHFPEAARIKVL